MSTTLAVAAAVFATSVLGGCWKFEGDGRMVRDTADDPSRPAILLDTVDLVRDGTQELSFSGCPDEWYAVQLVGETSAMRELMKIPGLRIVLTTSRGPGGEWRERRFGGDAARAWQPRQRRDNPFIYFPSGNQDSAVHLNPSPVYHVCVAVSGAPGASEHVWAHPRFDSFSLWSWP
ncbi:MAG TPA: hypothetical protein VHC70_05895 [Phycisphaerales bacterium]|nr:hypothetical protein [Phycisphaerales bacterium]